MKPQPIAGEELKQFFSDDASSVELQNLAEHISFQMQQASGIIEQNKLTLDNWAVYQAIKTIKEVTLPTLIEVTKDGWERHDSLPLIGQKELEEIQQIASKLALPPKPRSNSIQPEAFGYMLFDIHCECEKINPAMPWYSGDGDNSFHLLAVVIANKMGLNNESLDSLMRGYMKSISKPVRDNQKKFLAHMQQALGRGKQKSQSQKFQQALSEFKKDK